MAKKYKRSAAAQNRPIVAEDGVGEPRPTSMFARRATASEFNPDYTYIRNDLKRIGIMSGSFVIILFVLSFFLH